MSGDVDLVTSALAYAERDLPVFPCHSSGERIKAPLTEHGYKDATTDAEQIQRWWRDHPEAAIGIPTGAPWSTVLDFDVRPGGDGQPALDALRNAALLRGCSRIVQTPNDGLHLYFKGSEEGCHSLGQHYVDLKSVGGYVLAPPSRLSIDGEWRSYTEVGVRDGDELDWRQCASVLRDLSGEASTGGGLANVVERAPEGGRNNALFWAAARATEKGLSTEPLRLMAVRCGLPAEEVARTIGNGARAGGGR